MAVIRVNKTQDYTIMSNEHFKEKEMSLKAKGLLSLMLSLPDEWDYSIAGLVTLSKDGKDSVMGALSELEQFGYLVRTRTTNEKGQFSGYDYDIFEKPKTDKPQEEKPYPENPNTVKPDSENPPQLNTNISNTKKLNTKEKKERKKTGYDEILSSVEDDEQRYLYYEFLKMRKFIKSPMTDTALKMLIAKVNRLEPNSIERQNEMLKNAIESNWKSVYPLKDERGGQYQKQTNPASGFKAGIRPKTEYEVKAKVEQMKECFPDMTQEELDEYAEKLRKGEI